MNNVMKYRASHPSRILLLLTLAVLAPLAEAQRIERLGPSFGQSTQAQSLDAVVVPPPSLQLSLPPARVAALPPLGLDEVRLLQTGEGQQPPTIGIHRSLPSGPVTLSLSGTRARTMAEGAWQSIPAGRLWRLGITSPGARAMRVHFGDFAVGAGQVWIYSADGQMLEPYTGAGMYGDGEFWSDIVFGDSVTIEYLPDPASTEEAVPFQIVEISHIWEEPFGGDEKVNLDPPAVAAAGARAGESEAVKSLPSPIDVVVGTPSMEGAADDPRGTETTRVVKEARPVERSADLRPPVPKAATPLSPGNAVSFSLGPVDAPTLFTGDHSYRLVVPDGAVRVTVTLESNDPDVDVDLHVRYTEDNTLVDGRVVSDYESRGLTGNEEIVITGDSDPPLRSGTYFVSISLFSTGVEAEGTLRATVERDDTPDGSIGGGPLTPGQPSTFRLGPVDAPTLFAGNRSFQLQVPTSAARVVFRLESVDPSVDVDLYVRFGQDTAFQNGRRVFDHASQGLTGDERIGITRRSDPPLRAGTYFVSIRLFDTDVVADGILTATVETDTVDPHLDVACYPEWASSAAGVAQILVETSEGGTGACSGTLLNNSREDRTPYFLTAAHCVSSEAEARSVTALWNYQTRMCNGDLPTLQSVERTVGASLLSTLGGGDEDPDGDMALLRLEADPPNDVVFQGWDADPQPAGTEVTGIHHPGNDDWGDFKRISFGKITSETSPFGVSADTHAIVSWHPGQGYTEPGSSGSALFSSPGTVVGALSFGDIVEENAVGPVRDVYTHFSVFYPHISQFIDPPASESFSIPNLGGWSITSNGTEPATRQGYGRIRADAGSTTPSGIAIFGLRQGGTLIAEAGVPATEPVQEGRIFAEVNDRVNTGLAIANPNDMPATISFYFTDDERTRFGEGSFELGAHEQVARFLSDDPFNIEEDVSGTFTFTSSESIAVIALRGLRNQANEFLMTTLPVAHLIPAPNPFSTNTASTEPVYFPHFTDGMGWVTEVILVNPTDRTIEGTVGFLDKGEGATAASPAVLALDDGRRGSQFAYSIPARGSQRFTTSNPSDMMTSGSVRATPDSGSVAPSGLVVFSYTTGGKTVSESGVSALRAGSAFRVYAESSGTPNQVGSIRTGLAIVNTADTPTTVTLEVTGLDENLMLPPETLSLPPSGQVARFLDQIIESLPDPFSGVLRVTSTADVAIVGLRLRFNAQGELKMTTTPPSDEMGASTTADRFFPHIVDSAGWSTQFILFNGTAGASSGTLSFIDTEGQPLDLSVSPHVGGSAANAPD